MLKTAKFTPPDKDKLRQGGFLTATDLADYLALRGIPFREAHEITGKAVAYCMDKCKTLEDLTLAELKKLSE